MAKNFLVHFVLPGTKYIEASSEEEAREIFESLNVSELYEELDGLPEVGSIDEA